MARIKIVKKKTNTFDRFESDRHIRLNRSWRRPRGIDCRVRRRYRGLLMNKDKYCAEICASVGAAKRIQIIRRADELGVKLTNRKSVKITRFEKAVKRVTK